MRRFLEGKQLRQLVGTKAFVDPRWTYAVLAVLVCYSVFAAITLWSLFR